MALEVAAKAYVTGICGKMTLCAGEPTGLIQKADPIPGGQILQPPINIPMEFLIQLAPVAGVPSFHGCFDHAVKEGPTWPADLAHKMKFAYQ